MKSFEYGDEEIGFKEIVIIAASMVLGVGIITLPRSLAEKTLSSDGWISVLLAGGIVSIFAFMAARLVSRFPGQTFLQYASLIISKPLAYVLTVCVGVYSLATVAYQMRAVGNISKLYLFEQTPTSVLTLLFLLIVAYAVSGTRMAILRLNMMFFPIVFIVAVGTCVLNVSFFEMDHARPFFASSWREIAQGSKEMAYSLLGFEIVLFYNVRMSRVKHAGKAMVIGIHLVVLLYLLIYMSCIFVFGREVTTTLVYPTIELAQRIMIPGEFIERLESLFFTIWIMTIFNTSAMVYDVALMAFHSMIKKGKKIVYLSVLSPVIYLIGMTPGSLEDYFQFGAVLSHVGIFIALVAPAMLLIIAKMRKVGNET